MPPTVQTNNRHDARPRTSTEKRSDLVCRVKYNNALPDIPFDAKFITYPFDSNRYVQYNQTSLERSYKFDLLTEHDLGVPIDLINPDTYLVDYNMGLDLEDEALLEDEMSAPTDSKRSRHHNKSVSWLRKTEYISTEYNRFVQSAAKAEARLGYSIKKQMKEDVLYKDRDSQIAAINETFELVKKPIIQHYSKPGVTAVEVLPVFPDFEMWKHPCAQVIFDSDPAQKGKTVNEQMEEMSQAMIRGMVDESGDQFVAYFLPTPETLEKRRRDAEIEVDYEDGEEYDYVLAREYNWNVKNKASRGYEENYFFVMKDDGVCYNELETRVRLSKRRKVGAGGATVAKSRLIVRHRPLTDQEIAAQDGRVMMLEPPGDDDDMLHEDDASKSGAGSPASHHSNQSDDGKDGHHSDHSDDENVNHNKYRHGDSHSNHSHSDEEGGDKGSHHSGDSDADRASQRSSSDKGSRHSHSDDENKTRARKRIHSDSDDGDHRSKQSKSDEDDEDAHSKHSDSESDGKRDIFGSDDSD
jgi:RNA polymerase II-associated factor 1